ncbi:MAG: peptidylprolyl isomerase [Vicinamibacterales bacterium]
MRPRLWTTLAGALLLAAVVHAQTMPASRLAVLQAEDRRAPTSADVSRIRTQVRSGNIQTAVVAVRALGRLERPSLIASIIPSIRHRYPEIRAEAANAAAQAAEGWRRGLTAPGAMAPASLLATLASRLGIETVPAVRSELAQAIGRLPYRSAAEVGRAEAAILELAAKSETTEDRLGVAKGLESLARLSGPMRRPSVEALAALTVLLEANPTRDARVRRLAMEAIGESGSASPEVIARAMKDADAQVRRLALEAASASDSSIELLIEAADDSAPMVRLEALLGLRAHDDPRVCPITIAMAADPDVKIELTAIDQLRSCGAWSNAVSLLEHHAGALAEADGYRRWHRTAHAIVALAAAAPERARAHLEALTTAATWQIRLHAARAAATLGDVATLERLARDPDDNVAEAAIFGLVSRAGHEADATYVWALGRPGAPVLRAAAVALDGSSYPEAAPALRAALERINGEAGGGVLEARTAMVDALKGMGATVPSTPAHRIQPNDNLTARNLNGLIAPRARVIVRDVGAFELALVVADAPGTVTRFIALAESGSYDGTTFHGLVPDVAIHGGSPGASEYVGHPQLMRDEVGSWPHVRGAVGLATRGRDTGDGRFFINLVDNPRFDHEFTVFAQVLNGMDVVDRLLEGDVIERIEIIR